MPFGPMIGDALPGLDVKLSFVNTSVSVPG